jgi:hypothetical protein
MSKILIVVLLFNVFPSQGQEMKTENLIIITLDGYRWREVFEGADEDILFNKKQVLDKSVQKEFWADEKNERRSKLMPFLWDVVAKEGQLYGNRNHKNRMRCSNPTLYSYAGYSEMFVGFVDPRIRDNTPIANPNYTVLEYINDRDPFKGEVAIFSTWGTFPYIFREEESGLFINSGPDKCKALNCTHHEKVLNRLTVDIRNPYGERYDLFTFGYAFEYLKRRKPKVMFISFDETDEHGHGLRYDKYLRSAHRSDSLIRELWTYIQNEPDYKDKTTLIITTDHGRGTSVKGWRRHAPLFRGSAHVWLAVIGPDTPPTGEMKIRQRLYQKQIASTIAAFLDVPYRNVKPIGEKISTAIRRYPVTKPEDDSLQAGAGN